MKRQTTPAAACPRALGVALLLSGLLLSAVSGCDGRVVPPPVDPAATGQQAVTDFDKNSDGALDARELDQCPALKGSLHLLDANGDKRISAEEIAARVSGYQATRVGALAITCQVLLDGRPLAGATVTFVPERFLGPGYKPASGVCDQRGMARPQTEGLAVPGVAPGFYRVQVSRKAGSGYETIPGRYNASTVLGQEVAEDACGEQGVIEFRLSGS